MAEKNSRMVAALEGVARPGRFGRPGGEPGVVISEVRNAGLAAIVALRDHEAARAAGASDFGVELPMPARWAEGRKLAFVSSGPGRWLACRCPAPPQGMEAHLAPAFGAVAAIVDQSHGAVLLRASGRRIREALAKGLAIDLHPSAFSVGHAAITTIARISVHVWQIADGPSYHLIVPRSYAASFWRWLEASCGEFGLELAVAQEG